MGVQWSGIIKLKLKLKLKGVISMKNVLKMGLVAVAVIGSMSSAFAVGKKDAEVVFKGHMADVTCDINVQNSGNVVQLGTFSKADFKNKGDKVTGRDVAMLDLGSCAGVNVPKGETINLTVHENGGASALHTAQLFGDNADLGVGIYLTGKAIGQDGTSTDLGPITPDQVLPISTPDTDNDLDPTKVKLPKQLQITPAMQAVADPTVLKSGDINATVIFAAEYN